MSKLLRKKSFYLLLALLWLGLGGQARAQNNQNVTIQFGLQIGPSHQANLHWTASVSTGVTGYNVYRSVVSGSQFVKIGSVSASTTSYVDGGLPAGNTYFYVVTAVAGTGESGFSNQATGVVPTP